MKQSILLLFLLTALMSCSSAQSKDEITTVALKQLLAKKEIQLIDVRTPEEVEEGFIKSAKFVNYYDEDFLEQLTKVVKKDQPVYLYCRSGGRSGQATEMLKKEGFTPINVLGGYNQWEQENKEE